MDVIELPRVRAAATVSAQEAELVYVNDSEAGFTRRKSGTGFAYYDSDGKRVSDKVTVARLKALVIPPAWQDVWMCIDTTGHIQATGRDQKGRKQYRYHPSWTQCRDAAKFSSLAAFSNELPKLRQQVDADLRRHGLPRERVIASVIWLLDNTLIRIGNDTYRRENASFGLTTLRNRHLEIEGSALRFAFKGKSGKQWNLKLSDRRIANVVRAIQDLPGQNLFQYIDTDGSRRKINSHDVNEYIQQAIGPAFSSKHFRTWGATVLATLAFAQEPLPETKRGQTIALNAVIDHVAAQLRNTRSVCRRCYVHPDAVNAWLDDTLHDKIKGIRSRLKSVPDGLDPDEAIVRRWLNSAK
ncbi:DNA topoisomerase IB [Aureimonas fodinaquatilis]|uniref:DNA topoisomerase n=1 Tax=Aureimonas fodinaquatilis TaxID=2565783 RepID=A0A5B0DW96_9HYPH|nr:DNA topoisomerase IB [Aureimonas fodinaquatilis]KAA0970272.1 DNA topoisomerase IB [Aureimonas fodinaquatilis]